MKNYARNVVIEINLIRGEVCLRLLKVIYQVNLKLVLY